MIELIAADLDDTLLAPGGGLHRETIDALKRAMERGAYVTLSTGRMVESAVPIARKIGVNAPVILYNGALIRDIQAKGDIFRRGIPAELARRALQMCEEMDVYAQAYPGEGYYCRRRTDATARYAASIGVSAKETPDNMPLSEYITSEQMKLLAIAEETKVPTLTANLRAAFSGLLEINPSKPTYIEIVSAEVNKGSALEALAKYLNIPMGRTLAFGDGYNDVSMLTAAGIGAAVANAPEEVRAQADVVTLSNAENGPAKFIQNLLSQGKIGRSI